MNVTNNISTGNFDGVEAGELSRCRERLREFKSGVEEHVGQIGNKMKKGSRLYFDDVLCAIGDLEEKIDKLRAEAFGSDSRGVKIDDMVERVRDLPQRLEKRRIEQIFLKKVDGKTESAVWHISRSQYRELLSSCIVIRDEERISILRQLHKNAREANRIRKVWYGAFPGEDGFMGQGGMKKIFKLRNFDTGEVESVRAILKRYRRAHACSIEAAELFRGLKRVCTGRYLTYKKKDGFGVEFLKEVFVSPMMDSDLEKILIEGKWPKSGRIKLIAMKQMAEGLKSVHDMGWLHMDVKIDNFFVNNFSDPEEMEIRLADFDFAMPIVREKQMIPFKGTRFAIAPEVFFKESFGLAQGKKADIYSLGMAYWHLETRRKPKFNFIVKCNKLFFFPPVNNDDFNARLKDNGVPPESERSPLQRLIIRMIDPISENRPTMEQVIGELEALMVSASQEL